MTQAINPTTGQPFGPDYADATATDIDNAVGRAARAARQLRDTPGAVVAKALRVGADALDSRCEELVALADQETALGVHRLSGEVARTTSQMRTFAGLAATGAHLDAVITRHALIGTPIGDIRRVNRPIGVVAVFGSSNFPFAFGVAGGDTASALAAGCTVVAKAHPANPGTSQLVADVFTDALVASGLCEGTLTLIHGGSADVGTALVRHPQVDAVGFTGSTIAGRALFNHAASRPSPIPVYAEMGSLNPVVLAPSALHATKVHSVAEQLAAAITAGWGQFCTKPGLLLVPSPAAEAFTAALVVALRDIEPARLLSSKIRDGFLASVRAATAAGAVAVWTGTSADGGFAVPATVLRTNAATLLARDELREELFGPATVVVAVDSPDQVCEVITAIGGSLTGTVHGDPGDDWVVRSVTSLELHSGRVVMGGVPTGVAVAPAMQHGGPYPSSTSPSFTSVGTAAVRRFLRAVAYQDTPNPLLPPSLADANPWNIERVIDGRRTTDPIQR